jgi:nucleoside-diphosphate-sugar epimerase
LFENDIRGVLALVHTPVVGQPRIPVNRTKAAGVLIQTTVESWCNSDNALIRQYLGWEPSTPLRTGLEATYAWIYDQFLAREETGTAVGVR